MAVTKEQVLAAADQISAAGQRPTLEAVRKITGGSYTTISPALNEWKARQAATAAPLREPAPQAVADRLAEVGTELWAIALELANARLSSEREALEKVRADMEAAQAEATELADRLTAQVEEQQARLASIEAAEQAARAEVVELRGQLTVASEQAHTAEARAVEIERRAGELRQELDRAHQEADQVRSELATVKVKAEADRNSAREQVGTVREEAAQLRGQVEALQAQQVSLLRALEAKLVNPVSGA